jgi:hypothetical protein
LAGHAGDQPFFPMSHRPDRQVRPSGNQHYPSQLGLSRTTRCANSRPRSRRDITLPVKSGSNDFGYGSTSVASSLDSQSRHCTRSGRSNIALEINRIPGDTSNHQTFKGGASTIPWRHAVFRRGIGTQTSSAVAIDLIPCLFAPEPPPRPAQAIMKDVCPIH